MWVTTLTFLGHVTSSVTWPFESPGIISYRCSIVTESLSPTIFEIMGIFHIWVTTLTFLGHVTSSVTWPIDPPYVISYWCPIVTKPLSLTVFEILGPQIPCAHTRTQTHAASDFVFCPMQCIASDRQWITRLWLCCNNVPGRLFHRVVILLYKENFTARCTLVQSAVLRLHVVCPSVRPSVCPSLTLWDCEFMITYVGIIRK